MIEPPRPATSLLCTRDLVEQYLTAKANAGRAQATLGGYRWILNKLIRHFQTLPLDPAQLSAFIRSNSGQSSDSLKDGFSRVRGFYNWLQDRKLLASQDNPFPSMERPGDSKSPLPRILSPLQLRKVVEVSKAPFERSLILTLIDGGPRIGELVGRTKDDLADGALYVSGKTGGRMVVLSPEVYAYLQELPTCCLFPNLREGKHGPRGLVDAPASVYALKSRVTRVLLRSGLTGRKLGPHLLRHSFATQYINRGGDLKSLSLMLGHTSVSTTERYVSLALDSLKQAHAQHSVLDLVRGLQPATITNQLPDIELPAPAREFPLFVEGKLVVLMLVADRRPYHTYYYIRAREANLSGLRGKKWPVCPLGTDLPLNEVDQIRQAIYQENQRRRRFDSEAAASRSYT